MKTMRKITSALTATAALLAVIAAAPAMAQAAPAETVPAPDAIKLLQEYTNWWQPTNTTPNGKDKSTWYLGNVINKDILKYNDDVTVEINNKGVSNTVQSYRAGNIDDPEDWRLTMPDALGPVLGEYFREGVLDGSLSKVSDTMKWKFGQVGAGKAYFNYPRPYIKDRTMGNKNQLNGLEKHLHIFYNNAWASADTTMSGAFPSGHTTAAYSFGLTLAQIFPERFADIVMRSSEAGNNRIVNGVHYPLDIQGGRILGSALIAWQFSQKSEQAKVAAAHEQLVSYFTKRLKAAGYGDTLAAGLKKLAAENKLDYTNPFTDVTSTVPVTDHKSALKVYMERMTYGFPQTSQAGLAPKVPAGAAHLLAGVFPTLNEEQITKVLAMTEIDSGYPFDATSNGWERINWFAAATSKVTLDEKGNVVKVEPGQEEPSVVVLKAKEATPSVMPNNNGGTGTGTGATSPVITTSTTAPAPAPVKPAPQPASKSAPAANESAVKPAAVKPAKLAASGASSTSSLAQTGASVAAFAVACVVLACMGVSLRAARKRA